MKFSGCALDLMRLPAFCIYDALNEPSASSRIKVVCLPPRMLGAPSASAMPYGKCAQKRRVKSQNRREILLIKL